MAKNPPPSPSEENHATGGGVGMGACVASNPVGGFANGELIPPSPSQYEIVRQISPAMLLAGIRASGEWDEKRRDGIPAAKSDLVCAVYVAMRLAM